MPTLPTKDECLMTTLVFYLVVFLAVGVFFLFIHLVIGRVVRPVRPEPEKLTIYECGEPTIGSAWVQFDLRYYVIALLFVIFDVEVAFFFPWATVFGKANTLAEENLSLNNRAAITAELTPRSIPVLKGEQRPTQIEPETAHRFAWLAMLDIAVFFGVLLVGFAYLWRRGDLNWVRSTAAERLAALQPRATVVGPPVSAPEPAAAVPAGQSV
jgi:NADH-quinone oxidoreductase subunit A